MDPRLRNRGWLKLGVGFLIFIAFSIVVFIDRRSFQNHHVSQNVQLLLLLLYVLMLVFGIWGSIDLASAKGHGSEVVAAIVVLGFCCAPSLILGLPLIILFGLEDKTRSRRRRRH